VNAQKANNTIDKARQLQRKLYLAAKANSKRRFHALYDKIVREDILHKAWQKVKENKGAAGIDKITIEEIEKQGIDQIIREIQEKLNSGKYKPQPVKRVYIPKKDGGKRPLGIPVVIDRIIQAAAKIVIEPIFEADFQDCSYGFRPKRNAHQALADIRETIDNKGWYILDADITKYFDNINHDKLMILVERRISDKRVTKLIRKWLQCGVMEEGKYLESSIGAPQGGVISPLLSNIYLNLMDTL
jgi:RNA-directed DNA polymerase